MELKRILGTDALITDLPVVTCYTGLSILVPENGLVFRISYQKRKVEVYFASVSLRCDKL